MNYNSKNTIVMDFATMKRLDCQVWGKKVDYEQLRFGIFANMDDELRTNLEETIQKYRYNQQAESRYVLERIFSLIIDYALQISK